MESLTITLPVIVAVIGMNMWSQHGFNSRFDGLKEDLQALSDRVTRVEVKLENIEKSLIVKSLKEA